MDKRIIVAAVGLAVVLAAGGGIWFMTSQEKEPVTVEVQEVDTVKESTPFISDETVWESESTEFFDEDEDGDVTRIIIADDAAKEDVLLGEVLDGKVIINNEVVQDGKQELKESALGAVHGE